MKTPEEMAEEYCNTKQLSYVERLVITKGFLDGYQAAKDQLTDVSKVMPEQDGDLLHKVANDHLDTKAAKYRRVCGYKK